MAKRYNFKEKQIDGCLHAGRAKSAAACFVSSVSVFTYSESDSVGGVDFYIYRWDTDCNTTVAAEPVFTKTLPVYPKSVKDPIDSTWVTVAMPEQTIGEGEWLYEIRNHSENEIYVSYYTDKPLSNNSAVTIVQGYNTGRAQDKLMQSYVTYEKYGTTKPVTQPDPTGYTRLTEGKAHVILLAGQSNVTGQSQCALLENHATAEEMARYRAGYANVLIDYDLDGLARSNGFVPVKLGQSAGTDRFGEYMALGGMAFLDAGIYDGIGTPWIYAPILNDQKRTHADSSQNYYYLDTNIRDIDPRDENDDIAHYAADDMIELGELLGEGVAEVLRNAGIS